MFFALTIAEPIKLFGRGLQNFIAIIADRVSWRVRMAGWLHRIGEESPDSRKAWRRLTAGRGNPRDSATEMKPPAFGAGKGETVG